MKLFGNKANASPGGPVSGRGDCTDCGSNAEIYMLRDDVWFGRARAKSDTVLCIPCLEGRMRRPLTAADLRPEAIVNDPDSRQWPHTALYRRRVIGWTYRG
ncbi:hypothetical protein ACIQWB_35395 [Streptomyces olivaceus]|uniref:hypothetical protein n=1 Tax=Streptomyces olivaceus TaxID=47716 RepID=UPI003820E3A4